MIDFIKARPTEVWLGLWTAVVGVLQASGVNIGATLATAIGTLIGWLWTVIANKSDSLGPQG